LRRMHIAVYLARLSNGMVLYAWGYLTKAVDEEALESLRESIEEALNDLRGPGRARRMRASDRLQIPLLTM